MIRDRESNEDNDILLDTGSTCSVFHNKKLVTDIRPSNKTLRAYTNGGHQDSKQIATLPGFFDVWYNPASMVNILSYADVRKRFRITSDTEKDSCINVHMDDGRTMKFREVKSGLYLHNQSDGEKDNDTRNNVTEYTFLKLVSQNKKMFTRKELESGDRARDLYVKLGMPGYKYYFRLLESNHIVNCPVTADDAKRAILIYGEEVATLKGKTTRQKPMKINEHITTPLPLTIQDTHPTVNMSADYLYVQGTPFLHTISSNYKYRTNDTIQGKKATKK